MWAEEVASTHYYTVTFSGIGSTEEEQKVLQQPSWPRDVTDVGTATQVRPCHTDFCWDLEPWSLQQCLLRQQAWSVHKTDLDCCIQVAIFKCNERSMLPAES